MDRNFTKTTFAVRRPPESGGKPRWALLIGVIVGFMVILGFVIYLYKHQTMKSFSLSLLSSRFTSFLDDSQKGTPAEPKRLAAHTNKVEPQVHFEFYHTLPNVQLELPNAIVMAKNTNQHATQVITPHKPLVDKTNRTSSNLASAFVVAPEELERELSNQLKQKYLIQLGVFRGNLAAKRYHNKLTRAGLKVSIVKIKLGKEDVYRIQQGPFFDKDRAKSMQKMLHQKGIASLVIKANQA